MSTARTLVVVLLLVLAGVAIPATLGHTTAVAAGAQPAAATSTADYGDAPDPTYPTKPASNGVYHADVDDAVLGTNASEESGPRTTDTYDDGLAWVDDDTVRVEVTSDTGSEAVVVNLLVDRGADGDWNESGDWVVRNATGTTNAMGNLSLEFDLPVSRCDYDAGNATWLRVTLTEARIDGYDGTGAFRYGETEDNVVNGSGCDGSADVWVGKAANVSTVETGDDVTYTLAVGNDGPNATTVDVTDDLPACMQYVSASGPGSYDPGNNTWSVYLGAGDSATLGLTVTVACDAGYVTNDAAVSSNATDPDQGNNADSMTVLVTNDSADSSADLSLSKQADSSSVLYGDVVVYRLTVTNAGPDASRATVVDDLPPCVDVQSANGPGSYAGGTWTVDFQPGENATLELVTTVECLPGMTVVNEANVTGNVTDPDPADNDASAWVYVVAETDVSLGKVVNVSTVYPGEQVTYTLTVTNHGPSPTIPVAVDDDLPACTTFESAAGPGTYDPGANRWRVDLAPGQTAVLELVVTVDCASGTVTNLAEADPGMFDPDWTNNRAGATVLVETPPADLGLEKTANVSAVRTGDRVTYVLTVSNDGPSPANATVQEAIPSCLDVTSATGPGTFAAGNWTVGLQPGENATLELLVTVDCDPGYVTNTANATGNVTDPDPTDDAANATVTVLADRGDYFEFGDAPDPEHNTTLFNEGPYATRMPGGEPGPYAGENVSFEGAANLVNEDEHDDGFVEEASDPSTLTVRVTNDYDATNQNPVWVNVFVDLNGDGDWRDPGEWPVRNESVTVDGTETVSFNVSEPVSSYLAGSTSGGYTRLMVTAGAVPADLRGGRHSPWHWGEIEDYSREEMTAIADYDVSVPGFTIVHVVVALLAIALLVRRSC